MDQNDLYYVPGSWNVICDSCGRKIKASEAKQRWDGLIVCPDDFEMRQPQDFVKARADKITVPFTRPRPTDLSTGIFCDTFTLSGVADIGTANCAKADYIGDFVCRTFDVKEPNIMYLGIAGYGVAGLSIAALTDSTGYGDIATYVVCCPNPNLLQNRFTAMSYYAVSGYAVAGTPYSMSPN